MKTVKIIVILVALVAVSAAVAMKTGAIDPTTKIVSSIEGKTLVLVDGADNIRYATGWKRKINLEKVVKKTAKNDETLVVLFMSGSDELIDKIEDLVDSNSCNTEFVAPTGAKKVITFIDAPVVEEVTEKIVSADEVVEAEVASDEKTDS